MVIKFNYNWNLNLKEICIVLVLYLILLWLSFEKKIFDIGYVVVISYLNSGKIPALFLY